MPEPKTSFKTLQDEIWRSSRLSNKSVRGLFFAALRVISITWTVFIETKAASRAAALSFSSLLGLGPLIAIAVLVAGFVLGNHQDPNLIPQKLNEIIQFVAPQLKHYESLDQKRGANEPSGLASRPDGGFPDAMARPLPAEDGPAAAVNPRLVDMINSAIAGARSGSAGVVGVFSLILIVLLLFTTIEGTFNEIWGVRRGRSLIMRVVFYWTILTLGALFFFASLTLLGAGAFINVFTAKLPFGAGLAEFLRWSLPMVSTAMLVLVLAFFYRYIPNTRVFWTSALVGAVVVVALLSLNNYVAFLYVRRVILTKSLYGSLGVLPVLMFGLYIFWLYVLIGGQISYAVQNVHFRNSQAAWSTLTASSRERLTLVALLAIARRFRECLPPVSVSELGLLIKVPTQILNTSLSRLVDMGLITALPAAEGAAETDYRYQPARPLARIHLLEFKHLNDNLGYDPLGNALDHFDPVLAQYNAASEEIGEHQFFQKNLEQLLAGDAPARARTASEQAV